MVTFDDYTIDLSQFMHAVSTMKRPNERTTAQLMAPDPKDHADPALLGHIRSELLDRLASPLYAFAAGLIAFAALGEARTTRQGRGLAIAGAILAFAGVRMLGFAATTLAVGVLRLCLRLDDSACRVRWRVGPDLPPACSPLPLGRSRGARRDRQNTGILSRRPFCPHRHRRLHGGVRPYLRRRFGGTPASLRRFEACDRNSHGGPVVPANADHRRAGVAVCGSVWIDDRVPQSVAQDGAGRRARGRRVRLAIPDAPALRDGASRGVLGRRLQSGVDMDEAEVRRDRGQSVRRPGRGLDRVVDSPKERRRPGGHSRRGQERRRRRVQRHRGLQLRRQGEFRRTAGGLLRRATRGILGIAQCHRR